MKHKTENSKFSQNTMVWNLSDNEAVLMQLCESLQQSGFVSNLASEEEIMQGEAILQDFFLQKQQVFSHLLPRERLTRFINYIKGFFWDKQNTRKNLRRKILKSFHSLTKGAYHHANIRRSISLGLNSSAKHPLYELMMYVETYYVLILASEAQSRQQSKKKKPEEEKEFSQSTHFSIDDVLQLRKKMEERLEGRAFVQFILGKISQQQGVPIAQLLDPKEESPLANPIQPEKHVQFIRPAQTKSETTSFSLPKERLPPQKSGNWNVQVDTENEVVFGSGRITEDAMRYFLLENPASVLKFLFKKDLNGKPIPASYHKIYHSWQQRGLSLKKLQQHLFELMQWKEFPPFSLHEILQQIQERITEIHEQE